ncbi:MAG: GIY-YIG nuclease family protein [Caulobacteraceae bacterium]
MLTNRRHGTLYPGVTANLPARIDQHRSGAIPGFVQTYKLHRLVWFEQHESIVTAIRREKSLKKYKREWKINLIERDNSDWADLFARGSCDRAEGMGGRDKSPAMTVVSGGSGEHRAAVAPHPKISNFTPWASGRVTP